MLLNEATQTACDDERKALGKRVVKEGRELWKRQQEHTRQKKLQEQKELRDMLNNYWPWSRSSDSKPRGLRNLRLDEIFPNKDYQNAKRFVGTLDLGRPGGGAPIVNKTGKKQTRTREDPILRFQFGSKDLRRCVDNNLRYKTDKEKQMEYKKQLDKLVEEKKLLQEQQKKSEQILDADQGWSNEDTLRQICESDDQKMHELAKTTNISNSNSKFTKLEPLGGTGRRHFINAGKYRKLSPLSEIKDNGVELVSLLAKDRKMPLRIPLTSTDVTSCEKTGKSSIWFRQGSAYLKELQQQMIYKQQHIKDMKAADNEVIRRHFSTWDGFWGRPGNGAPRSGNKKQSLDRLLYPHMIPIGVH